MSTIYQSDKSLEVVKRQIGLEINVNECVYKNFKLQMKNSAYFICVMHYYAKKKTR